MYKNTMGMSLFGEKDVDRSILELTFYFALYIKHHLNKEDFINLQLQYLYIYTLPI